jgi:hypothetical protein
MINVKHTLSHRNRCPQTMTSTTSRLVSNSTESNTFEDLLNECHERVSIQQQQVTHFEIAPYQQVRRGYHLKNLDEVKTLEQHLYGLATAHEMAYFWEWLDLDKRHVFFVDIKDVLEDNLKKLMRPFMEWLHEKLTEEWLEQRFREGRKDHIDGAYSCSQLYELTELQTNSRRIIIPWLVLPHNECLALFDLILVSSMDKFPGLTKKFDRTALDNGRIKMPYCDEIDPMHKPLDRPFVIKVTSGKDNIERFVHHSKLSIRYPYAERELTLDEVDAHCWKPKGQLKDIIMGITYRKKPNYPRKEPWMIQRDPYAWDVNSSETFDWHYMKHTVEELHKSCDSITKRKLVVDYMNRFFAVITMDGQVEVIVKQWDTTKDCSYFTRRPMNDFLMAMENKTFWLKHPTVLDGEGNGRRKTTAGGRGRGARSQINSQTIGSNYAQGNIMEMFDPRDKRSRDDHQRLEREIVNQAGDNAGPLPIGLKGKGEAIGKMWRYALDRKEFSRQVFNPFPPDHKYGARHDELNTWTGLRYTYAECKKAYNNPEFFKRAKIILHHIRFIICKDDEINYKWLLMWFASTIQRPWFKLHTMPVIYGYPGAGKGIILTPYVDLFGQHGLPCHDMSSVLGKFNSQVEDKCMVWLDEAMSPGSKKEENAFKLFITEGIQNVEKKFKDAKLVRNFCNVIASTNDLKSVPAGNNSRRYFCLDMDNRYSMNREAGRAYFDRLQHAIEADDFAGMKAWQAIMMEIDISNFDRAQNPPQTALLRIQQHEQVDSVTRWLYDCCERGFHCKVGALQDNNHLMMFTFKDGRVGSTDDGVLESEWIREISKKDLYDNYCDSTPKQPVTQTAFFMRLKELLPSIIDKTVTVMNGKQVYGSIEHKIRVMENGQKVRRNLVYIILPSLDDARMEFKHSTGFGFTAAATTMETKRKKILIQVQANQSGTTSTTTTVANEIPGSVTVVQENGLASTSMTTTPNASVQDVTVQTTDSNTTAVDMDHDDGSINAQQAHNPYDYFDPQTWENLKLLLEQVDQPMPLQDDPTQVHIHPEHINAMDANRYDGNTYRSNMVNAIPRVKYPDEPSSSSGDEGYHASEFEHEDIDIRSQGELDDDDDDDDDDDSRDIEYHNENARHVQDMELMRRAYEQHQMAQENFLRNQYQQQGYNRPPPKSIMRKRVRRTIMEDQDSNESFIKVNDTQRSGLTPGQTNGVANLFMEPEAPSQLGESRLTQPIQETQTRTTITKNGHQPTKKKKMSKRKDTHQQQCLVCWQAKVIDGGIGVCNSCLDIA